jgi:hypothetical protein
MSAQDNGGPAFPQFGPQVVGLESDGAPKLEYEYSEGMTLRDAFAKEAMQGAIAGHISYYGHESNHWQARDIASYAYELADAMLEARKK